MMKYISHPCIKPDTVEERSYQTSMVKGCLSSNTLLILPTGLGKTIIALYVAAEYVSKGKVLILAPTKPLLDQHLNTFNELMVGHTVCLVSGEVDPKKRAELVAENDVVIGTPQTVCNDLESGKYNLDPFSLIIYDEAHRGVGDYAYVRVAEYCSKDMRSIGMTASPGANMNRIKEVCINLRLGRIDARTEDDPDVAPYVHDTYVINLRVNMPDDLLKIDELLKKQMNHYVGELISLKLMNPARPPSRQHFLDIQRILQMRLNSGEKTAYVYRGLSLTAMGMKIYHAIMLAETQGITPLKIYLKKLDEEAQQEKGGRSARDIVNGKEFIEMRKIVDTTKVEHPKVSKVMSIVSKTLYDEPDSKVMVFAQYRDTCDMLVSKLSGIENAKVGKLIGQSGHGLKQREQIELLEKLRNGEINVIVSTSVGEEGLDISSTNAVIFYEPIPSEIRTIQRRGRTGRKNDGDVYVLIANGTMDEAAENTSKRKEETMKANIEKLNQELSKGHYLVSDTKQKYLDGF